MSGAVAATLCCCDVPEVCGSCPNTYRIYWSGSIELLSTCCPVVYCPDPNKEAGEFTTACNPCDYSIDAGGNQCRGDCPGDGCRLLIYDGSIGPGEIVVTAQDIAPPCIYSGSANGSIEVRYCCPADPERPECGSGIWGSIDFVVSVSMMRGGFGFPDKDWVIRIDIVPTLNPYGCTGYSQFAGVTFHAPNSGDLCPHEVTFEVVKANSYGFTPSMLDPCNRISDYCPEINIHAGDYGQAQAIIG